MVMGYHCDGNPPEAARHRDSYDERPCMEGNDGLEGIFTPLGERISPTKPTNYPDLIKPYSQHTGGQGLN